MTDASPRDQGLAGLSLDPELLARELAAHAAVSVAIDPHLAQLEDEMEQLDALHAAPRCSQGPAGQPGGTRQLVLGRHAHAIRQQCAGAIR